MVNGSVLQQQHAQQLQVITVTSETHKRIRQYVASRPSNLWVAIDSANSLTRLFPHQLIPHTILLSADGKRIAATDPQAITRLIIDSIGHGKTVHLPEKTDYTLSVPEVIQPYFKVTGQQKNRFVMQAEMKGLPNVRTTHGSDSMFNDRRLTCLNLPLLSLYQVAYGDISHGRTIDRTNGQGTTPVYCLDMIPRPADLLPTLKNELASRFDLRTKVEAQLKEVNVLTIKNQAKFDRIVRNSSGNRAYSARSGEIDQQATTMTDFADFLENFGTSKGMVVDETGNHEKLDIKFSFQPENPQSLSSILDEMGLGLSKQNRSINMLILYE